ncbi:hypothetical protein [Pseudoxanthomonas koreensis]|uniref:hypothetical protein n=1 Tax=Pseudoxanthomonas koreensis TaxID=266061 RepID=UPI0035A6EF17
MTPHYIFIIGVAKAGTTALAGWLVSNGLATYAIPGVKEPGTYLRTASNFHPPAPPLPGQSPLLDATPGYFDNQRVVSRLPEHHTRVALCLRNPFERAWSDYRMKKLLARRADGASQFIERLHQVAGATPPDAPDEWHRQRKEAVLHSVPRASAHHVEAHFDAETSRLLEGSFLQRLAYETAFFQSRQVFPHQPVLRFSFYYHGLRMLLDRYQPEDVVVLTTHSLSDPDRRAAMAVRLAGGASAGPPLDSRFTLSDLEFDEPEPDFSDHAFDPLRSMFAYDLEHTLDLLSSRGVSTDLIDPAELHRHIG